MGEPSSFTKASPMVHLPTKNDVKESVGVPLAQKDTLNRPFGALGEPFCSTGEPSVKDKGSPVFHYKSIYCKKGETLKLTMEKWMEKGFDGMRKIC